MKIFNLWAFIELYSITFFSGVGEFSGQGIDPLSFTYAIDNFEVKRERLDSIHPSWMIMRMVRNVAYEWNRECLRKISQMGEIEYKSREVMEIWISLIRL